MKKIRKVIPEKIIESCKGCHYKSIITNSGVVEYICTQTRYCLSKRHVLLDDYIDPHCSLETYHEKEEKGNESKP